MADRRCLVCVCHNGPVVYRETAVSLAELGWGDRTARAKTAHGFAEISLFWEFRFPRVDTMRDSALVIARDEGFSHVLFLDADMVWPTYVLLKMLAHHDKGIVGGLYVLRGPPYNPVALVDGFLPAGSQVMQYYHAHDATKAEATELMPVQALGMGCTLVPLTVLDRIGSRPWFAYGEADDGWPKVSEDVAFCAKARAAGVPLWLDPTVRCGHVDTMIRDHRWHRRYLQGVEETQQRMQVRLVPTEPEALMPAAAGGLT